MTVLAILDRTETADAVQHLARCLGQHHRTRLDRGGWRAKQLRFSLDRAAVRQRSDRSIEIGFLAPHGVSRDRVGLCDDVEKAALERLQYLKRQ